MPAQAPWDCVRTSLLLQVASASINWHTAQVVVENTAAGVVGSVISLDKTGVQVNQLKGQSAGHDEKAGLHRQFRTAFQWHKNIQQCR